MSDTGLSFSDDTLAIRAGHTRSDFREHSEAIYTSSSFVFDNAQQAAACFSGDGDGCIATSSGMSAIMTTVLSLLSQGDHIVAARSMFGATVTLFEKVLPRFGISCSWVDVTDAQSWRSAISANTRMMFLETPTNPLTEIADIKALSAIAREHDISLVVDNCFCTPVLQKPLSLGAHYVVHSATKYLDGQGRCIGGAIAGPEDSIKGEFLATMRSAGPSMSPFNAWVFTKGLETLGLRMQRHCDNAMHLAEWLVDQPWVEHVYFPGLKSHPQHELAQLQQNGFGGIVSFDMADQRAAWRLIDKTRLLSITANLGDARTTITHPASTTHGRLSQQARDRAGIGDGLVRIAVGLENIDDIIADLQQAFKD